MKILIADDESMNLRMLAKHYQKEHQVLTAANGRQALNIIDRAEENNEPFECVITDYQMPLANGREVAMKCLLNKIPCVVMSGDHSLESVFKGLPTRFLSKPFSFAQLDDAIKAAIER